MLMYVKSPVKFRYLKWADEIKFNEYYVTLNRRLFKFY